MKTSFSYVLMRSVLFAAITSLAAETAQKTAPGYIKGDIKNKITLILSAVAAFFVYGNARSRLELIQGFIIIFLCVYASRCDIAGRKLPDWVSLCLFMTGFAGITEKALGYHLFWATAVFGFLFLCAVFSNNRFGGADIKFSAAFCFILGMKGVPGLMLGLFMSVVGTLIRNKTKKGKMLDGEDKEKMPVIPYLSAGYFIIYLL